MSRHPGPRFATKNLPALSSTTPSKLIVKLLDQVGQAYVIKREMSHHPQIPNFPLLVIGSGYFSYVGAGGTTQVEECRRVGGTPRRGAAGSTAAATIRLYGHKRII